MNDIFISYAREDQEQAEALAKALRTQNWSVFWDRTIPAGETWDEYIETNLKTACCVVVAWSANSIRSSWVKEEAHDGRERKILIPVFFEQVQPPLGFRSIQAIDLSKWNKSSTSPAFQDLVNAVNRILKSTPKETKLPNEHHHQYVTTFNPAKALEQIYTAIKQSDTSSQHNLGTDCKHDISMIKDKTGVMKCYYEAAKQGDVETQNILEIMVVCALGKRIAQDDAKVVKHYRRATKQGDAETQNNLETIYALRVIYRVIYTLSCRATQDNAEVVKRYRKAAEQGDTAAQNILGSIYALGYGVAQNDAEAVRWYQKAAEQGDTIAQNNLGGMHALGYRVAQDDAEAVKWYQKAADQGYAIAQNNLGVMYALGKGIAQNDAEAAKWHRKAAEQGDAIAQNTLGVIYALGKGVSQDDTEAAFWYRKAAEQYDTNAKSLLEKYKECFHTIQENHS